MIVKFFKYQGAGNDFVMLDNRLGEYSKLTGFEINKLCNRNFGIGADGLIMLENAEKYHFGMRYFNADGNESTMCGNGGRCTVAFAKHLGIEKTEYNFMAIDGEHKALITNDKLVQLQMIDTLQIQPKLHGKFLNTGSPHFVLFVENLAEIDVFNQGKILRNHQAMGKGGANINFVEKLENGIKVRTYERGVENETLACGTGSVASAICFASNGLPGAKSVAVEMPGGKLIVEFTESETGFNNVWLTGPACFVFEGTINLRNCY
ncbi:MAG TPA: diaminopimelate epimerase [Bacteroidales bacterium]|nr:diaminopimelate epimerase [Bacteroidales bacterium]